MARTRIKICGITTPADARAAVAAGADAIGLMFVEHSPRVLTPEQAERIVAVLPAFVEAVGVFASQPMDYVADVAGRLHLRTVQLHGREEPAQAATLGARRIIKALPFDGELEPAIKRWRRDANLAAALIDAPPPKRDAARGDAPSSSNASASAETSASAELTGGHGETFDWHALAALGQRGMMDGLALLLAGGLDAENVGEAIATVRPYGVDVSSGVERTRGVKDADRIAAFCEAVQAADHRLAGADAPR